MGVRPRLKQAGFTIIELMIATLVFSIIIIIIVTAIMQITRTYYKGVTLSNTQNVARSVMDNISQAIQFGGVAPQVPSGSNLIASTSNPNPKGRVCIGNQAYDFQLGYELPNHPHALTVATVPGCSPSTPPTFGGTELLSPNMRLSRFDVQPLGNDLWQVSVTVAYGDDDLLCNTSLPGNDCQSNSNSPLLAESGSGQEVIACKGQTGSQFCGVSSLSTVVQQRLVSGQ